MNSNQSPDRAAQALREAHSLLDERPSPATRARILAAAVMRQTPPSVAAASRATGSSGPWRWLTAPWFTAAGAMSFVAILAMGIVLRLQHEQTLQTAQVSLPEPQRKVAPAAAPASSTPAAPSLALVQADRAQATKKARSHSEAQEAPAAPPTAFPQSSSAPFSAGKAPGTAPQPLAPAVASAQGRRTQASEAIEGGAPPAAARASVQDLAATSPTAKAQSPDAAPAPTTNAALSTPTPSELAHARLGKVPSSPVAGSAGATTPAYRASVDTWLARIRELRRTNRESEVQTELKLFRDAHPQAILPEDLRAP